jgi:hypothetical protein
LAANPINEQKGWKARVPKNKNPSKSAKAQNAAFPPFPHCSSYYVLVSDAITSQSKCDGLFLHLLAQMMHYPRDPALRKRGSHPKAAFIVFAAFLLEDYHLFTVAYRFNDGFDIRRSDIGAAHQSVGFSSDEWDRFKGDLL